MKKIYFLSVSAAVVAVGIGNMGIQAIKAQTCLSPTVLNYTVPSGTLSTCGAANNFTQYHACGNTFMNGQEYVFSLYTFLRT